MSVKTYSMQLTRPQIETVARGLAKLPYEEVAQLLVHMQAQVAHQDAQAAAAEKASGEQPAEPQQPARTKRAERKRASVRGK